MIMLTSMHPKHTGQNINIFIVIVIDCFVLQFYVIMLNDFLVKLFDLLQVLF